MKWALLTGGGDCPGMNAWLRAAVRSARNLDPEGEVVGVIDGWRGLIHNSFRPLHRADVAGILHKGGTIIGTMRAPEFLDVDVQRQVVEHLTTNHIDVLLVLGGNGSLRASRDLELRLQEANSNLSVLVAPGSIDNDVANNHGYSVGFNSAIEKSVHMQQWIRDTASSHRRVFIIGSMGRKSAYLAFYSGIASGSEYTIRSTEEVDYDALADMIAQRDRDTRIIVAEGYPKSIEEVKNILQAKLQERDIQQKINAVDMGYFQRGGQADISDVLMASWLAFRMVKDACAGANNAYYSCFYPGQPLEPISLEQACDETRSCHPTLDPEMIELARVLR